MHASASMSPKCLQIAPQYPINDDDDELTLSLLFEDNDWKFMTIIIKPNRQKNVQFISSFTVSLSFDAAAGQKGP